MLPVIVFPDLTFAEVLQTYYHDPRQKTVVLETRGFLRRNAHERITSQILFRKANYGAYGLWLFVRL